MPASESDSTENRHLRVHHFLQYSYTNGPGRRAVLWLQGCSLNCPGCFNPNTHPFEGGELIPVEQVLESILAVRNTIEGITISGGEPLQQQEALIALLKLVRAQSDLSVLLFSGFNWREIRKFPLSGDLYDCVDVLISGRYIKSRRLAHGLLGSSNKRLHFFTRRYSPQDFQTLPEAEMIITETGEILMSGIDPLKW